MKKLFYVVALAAFVACNSSSETEKTDVDTLKQDTVPAVIDTTTINVDTTAKDTLAK